MMNGSAEEAIRVWMRQVNLAKVRHGITGYSGSPVAQVKLAMREPEPGRCIVVDLGPCDSPVIADGKNWSSVAEALMLRGVVLR